ncbi:50S ribosomal protein L7ae-like protein [Kyrpidia spormannii]|uniref:RNA-binding protein COOX1_0157 n=2 Tax=Kyrpidia spormannii TaxID=2055160 RepID=A0A2K8N440_9BACL|nr:MULTISPECIES: 50S ribosomal protein L7ae-like protein [Kyrpidia]HHY67953.1 50S ribosomal protein L7ae-like protein [Alicyclobacillus sp.]ATY83687.1 50S ribosomal protein L7ae-like protein [Kyrpidia spormannii]MCL6575353.1 50S ribosomal protein L7ae-like protein [Kyrpidia sp.]CAB3389326.1 K-turn RNA binding protein; alternative ribosomal protein L7A [Kyrpidia spormannii]CAB3389919.1 K-turn RNA binding protein; alternative ribosomal protein L7A [Kyrpidia spormannii]
MPYDRLKRAKRIVIGTNQTLKALQEKSPVEVYVAKDADRHVVARVVALCEQKQVSLVWVDSMKQLGKACGIDVGAAAAAIIEENST